MFKKNASLKVVLILGLLLGGCSKVIPIEKHEASNPESVTLTILDPELHPPKETLWEVRFQTNGKADLNILPNDKNTDEDITFDSLSCGEEKLEPLELLPNVIVLADYTCPGISTVRYLITEEGSHNLRFKFGDRRASAHNDTGDFVFAKRLGGTGYDYAYGITADNNDRIIVSGFVGDWVGATQGLNADLNGDGDSADGGPENAAGYGYYDPFFSVFNASGTFQFAKRLGGVGWDSGYEVTTDSNNRIIISGFVDGDADLSGDGDYNDPGESATGYGTYDAFFSVFDSAGNWVFAKRLGGTFTDYGYSVTTDSNNRIIVCGSTKGDADLDGDGDATGGGAESATGYGDYDAFFSVFDSAGNWVFAKRLGGTVTDRAYRVTTDSNDRIIVSGMVAWESDINGDGDSTDGGAEDRGIYSDNDAFFSVFDSAGNWVFAKRLGGPTADIILGVTTDNNNRIIVVGSSKSHTDLNSDGDYDDSGESRYGNSGVTDAFISIFDSSGNFQWAKRLGGTGSDNAKAVVTDSNGQIIVTGTVYSNADLNGDGDSTDGGAEDATGYAYDDAFFSVFDSTGNWQYAKRLGSTNVDRGLDIAVDSFDRVLITGQVYDGDADFSGDGDYNDSGESSIGYDNNDIFFSVFGDMIQEFGPIFFFIP
ncbi:MAG TPA: SBBP repeat-containing protein [Candidatus Gracilibacteria bacterium]